MLRTSEDVVAQAIVWATLGFRGSLEVTEHPRAREFCERLLPWLEELGLGLRVEEFHREILEIPHRELSQEQLTEAVWRSESALLLGWALQLLEKPGLAVIGDAGRLVGTFWLLRPAAADLRSSARLRPQVELEDFCVLCIAVRQRWQLSTLEGDAKASLCRIHQLQLAMLGLGEAVVRQEGIEELAAQLESHVPSVKGLYVVRALAAEWLFGQDVD